MMTYRDFDTYLKNYPDENGYFGEYGGAFLSPELIPAFEEANSERKEPEFYL